MTTRHSDPHLTGSSAAVLPPAAAPPGLEHEVAALIVTVLNLDVAPQDIDPHAPLHGDGLGLDSIDVLEVALAVGKRYGVQLKAQDHETRQIFGSLSQLVEHIAQHRTR